jgi:hypothetical protein
VRQFSVPLLPTPRKSIAQSIYLASWVTQVIMITGYKL